MSSDLIRNPNRPAALFIAQQEYIPVEERRELLEVLGLVVPGDRVVVREEDQSISADLPLPRVDERVSRRPEPEPPPPADPPRPAQPAPAPAARRTPRVRPVAPQEAGEPAPEQRSQARHHRRATLEEVAEVAPMMAVAADRFNRAWDELEAAREQLAVALRKRSSYEVRMPAMCGSAAGYAAHQRAKEEPCRACIEGRPYGKTAKGKGWG